MSFRPLSISSLPIKPCISMPSSSLSSFAMFRSDAVDSSSERCLRSALIASSRCILFKSLSCKGLVTLCLSFYALSCDLHLLILHLHLALDHSCSCFACASRISVSSGRQCRLDFSMIRLSGIGMPICLKRRELHELCLLLSIG